MKKLLLSMLVFLFLVGCSKPTSNQVAQNTSDGQAKPSETADTKKDNNNIDIGIVLPNKQEPRWIQDETRFRDYLSSTTHKVDILFSEGNPAVEKTNVETLISRGVKVLIIAPHDGEAASSAVEAAKQAGLTVIAYDRLIMGTDAVDYAISFDNIQVGRLEAQYLVDQLNGQTGQSLYYYSGSPADNNAFLAFQGTWEVLQPKLASGEFIIKNSSKINDYKDIKDLTKAQMSEIINQTTTMWDQNTAKTKAETDSSNASGTVYILAPNDTTGRPIYDVFANTSGVTKAYITGEDCEKPSIQSILDGKQSMSIFKDIRLLSKAAVDTAISVLENKQVTTAGTLNNGKKDIPTIGVDIVPVDIKNVKDVVFGSGYYKESEFTMPTTK